MKLFFISFLLLLATQIYAQTNRIVPVAVSSIELNSNAHLGGMADITAVSSVFYPDAGMYQNPALLATNTRYFGMNISDMPVLINLLSNAYNASFNGFYSLDNKNVIAYSYSRFTLGSIVLMDKLGYPMATVEPTESYHKLSYSRVISKLISVGLSLKLIDSDLGHSQTVNTYAVDLGFSYRKHYYFLEQFNLNTNFGSSINNLGPKVSYDESITYNFIPTNLKLGALLNPEYVITNKFNLNLDLAVQLEKDLIPSEPVYDSDNSHLIVSGYNPDISSFQALFQSFYDSPAGFSGELNEFRCKFGTELRANYDNKLYLVLRYGRYNETSMLDHNNLTTMGVGIGIFGFSLDYKSLKPDLMNNANTNFAITLGYSINLNGKAFRF